jgi:hypothetical protein
VHLLGAESAFTEYQPRGRVEVYMVNRDPFRLDTIQSPVCPEATVTSELAIFFKITAAPVGMFSAFFHCYYSLNINGEPC